MTVLDAIQKSTDFLARKGVDSPRLQSELLLAHVLKTERLKLYLDFARPVPEAQADELRQLVRRRGEREPLQHILGSSSFCGYEIAVNRQVLIPRPETELLAEQGWKFLNRLVEQGSATPRFLDFGTGSGCIAIALAGKCPAARGVALEASAEALEMAGQNFRANGVESRIIAIQGDSLQAIREKLERFECDLLISNPPYIPSGDIPHLQEEVRDFDPRQALDGGADGLAYYRLLAFEAAGFLTPNGKIMLEFGDGQEEAISEIFSTRGWSVAPPVPDYSGRPRILIAEPPPH